MSYSMTGFAAAARETPAGRLSMEIKSVNSRYLEMAFRLPDECRHAEMALRERFSAKVKRGKLECRMAFSPAADAGFAPELDSSRLAALLGLENGLRQALPEARPLSVAEILAWPGVLCGAKPSAAGIDDAQLFALADEALGEFLQSRAREGEKLVAAIRQSLETLRGLAARIAPLVPEALAAFSEKLSARVAEAFAKAGVDSAPDPARLAQEVAVQAAKMDVAEESERLAAHISELDRLLAGGGPLGKRVDFLVQELNREANTLASKSASLALTQIALDMKLAIEQIREQIQNLE
jgi:uncharacterized protein (TIGR00255 family)